jgi:hypothetical protein
MAVDRTVEQHEQLAGHGSKCKWIQLLNSIIQCLKIQTNLSVYNLKWYPSSGDAHVHGYKGGLRDVAWSNVWFVVVVGNGYRQKWN